MPGRSRPVSRLNGSFTLSNSYKQIDIFEPDYVGQAEFTANWGEGYGKMTAVDASKLRP